MTATKFARLVNQHSGTVTAQNDQGLTRVEFKNYQRLTGFEGEVQSRFMTYTVEGNAVVVQL